MANPITESAVPAAPARRATTWQAVLLLAGSCMPVMGSVLITPILPQLSEEFGATPGAEVLVPMIVAIPALMIALFAPFAGQIVDRLGRRTLLVIAMVAYALAGTAPALLDDLQSILASRVLVGICEAAIMTACTTLIVDYFHQPERRNKYLGLQTVATTLGATAFIAIGGALGVGGWHTPFWVYSVALVLAVLMAFSLWEPSRTDSTDTHVGVGEKARIPWSRIAMPLAVTLFGGFSFYVLIIEASYLVVGTGVEAADTRTIGAVSAIASLATAAGAFTFARVARLQPRVLLPIAFGLQAAGMLVIWATGTSFIGVGAGAVIASAGSGLLLPTLVTWTIAPLRFEERGRSTGWWNAAFFLGQFATPLIMGGIANATGSLPVAVGIVGVAAATMAVVLGVALRRQEATAGAIA
ncbi:MFS transporter [Demequina sp. SYSU T00192]|uniref:MFS transporter n=1 Tax=Demequina litoralis TaxID=3051660 RepID=A0ABT8G7S8_9MICO|nr:MFS transporter [Demequina sp. SYSU T00192]MDN4474739.1 MFS transporter [Demequina sp. SYSU T00192]